MVLILFSSGLFSACKDDLIFDQNGDSKVELSADTIVFDTVFTSPGPGTPMSVNKQFVIRNPHKNAIRTSVQLADPDNSFFRLNVDGLPGKSFEEVEILGGDSVFVFVELTVDPNDDPESRPLIVRDSIQMTTNGNLQQVQLRAWGQDAHYFFQDTLCDTILDDKIKPYVVYGYLYVPEDCKLTIEEGVKLHFAPSSWLFVEGTLEIIGTKDEPVKFEGDRLEPDYEEVAGQWGGIWLSYPSKGNEINYVDMKNGLVGIYCDSSSSDGNPTVKVQNSLVRNMLFDGMSGKGSYLTAQNSAFTNCGRFSFLGLYGGRYELKHCTFATYNFDFARRDPTFFINNIERDDFGSPLASFPLQFLVQNCIIAGSEEDEIALDIDTSKLNGALLGGNLIQTSLEGFDQNGNVINEQPNFISKETHDYQLDTLSGAKDIGNTLSPPISTDLLGNPRDSKPDAGAYERIE